MTGHVSERSLAGRVLVVDDERPNRLYLRKLLSARGCEVIEAENGPVALERAHGMRPDLILVDVVMPGMDGFELCGKLKSDPRCAEVPVVMVTAKTKIDDLARAFEMGALDYIRKPFNPRELVLRVGNALELKRSNESLQRWKTRVSNELRLAGTIQRTFFSDKPFFSSSFEIRIAYQPCMDVGGDAFDIVELPSGRLCVYVGDVSGHGVAPAMISTYLKASFGELVRNMPDAGPADLCNELHARFRQSVDASSYYATFFVAIHDPETNVWRCMNCGHPSPLLVRDGKSGAADLFEEGGGVPIGFPMLGDAPYRREDEVAVQAEEGTYFVLYTDGILEARHEASGELCGRDSLRALAGEVLARENEFNKARGLLREVQQRGYSLEGDDCTSVCIYMKRKREVALERFSPPELEEVSRLAAETEGLLKDRGWSEDAAASARLLLMEHGANIVYHSELAEDETFWVQINLGDEVCRIVAIDRGREWNIDRRSRRGDEEDMLAEGGRGLAIIDAVADYVERYRINHSNVSFFVIRREQRETE
ncbi:ATP-binding SpoIIE family protein phosphatase [Kiritimatiella glycovorans]|uniref:Response regulator receiver modulated serine phosphatase n=1 Tax=Kiritimatiella glycovorans TaxID=1307763 RepID=A0A0G3EGF9_9BACT|nr:SpoIIE family protein phosphatase [Kiritimatiella glycovorans]AKJ64497.1 Response regulator receiver modulated serine phosphatase [Kiritimatiella glycovorans]